MSEVRVIQINESVFAENGREAEIIRNRLTAQGTLFLNVMSSPGSGKTTTLVALINRLKDRLNIGEMDVDIESSLDAQRVADMTGIRSSRTSAIWSVRPSLTPVPIKMSPFSRSPRGMTSR